MDIKRKWWFLKLVPAIGLILCLIDSTHDGFYLERFYVYYHVVMCSVIIGLIS